MALASSQESRAAAAACGLEGDSSSAASPQLRTESSPRQCQLPALLGAKVQLSYVTKKAHCVKRAESFERPSWPSPQ